METILLVAGWVLAIPTLVSLSKRCYERWEWNHTVRPQRDRRLRVPRR